MNDPYAAEWLHRELERRKLRNASYSMRAFARDLSISPSTLLDFISRKRDLTVSSAEKILQHITLERLDAERFLLSCKNNREEEEVEKEFLEMMSFWHHFAILNLAKLPDNQASPHWISRRLAIKEQDASVALETLQNLNLIEIIDGRIRRNAPAFYKQSKFASELVKKHHRSILSQASVSLLRDPSYLRDMRAMLIPIEPNLMSKAKDILLDCRNRIASLLSSTDNPKLYILSYYLFPVN